MLRIKRFFDSINRFPPSYRKCRKRRNIFSFVLPNRWFTFRGSTLSNCSLLATYFAATFRNRWFLDHSSIRFLPSNRLPSLSGSSGSWVTFDTKCRLPPPSITYDRSWFIRAYILSQILFLISLTFFFFVINVNCNIIYLNQYKVFNV